MATTLSMYHAWQPFDFACSKRKNGSVKILCDLNVHALGALSFQIFTNSLLCSGDLESIQLAGQTIATISKSTSKSNSSQYQVVIEKHVL